MRWEGRSAKPPREDLLTEEQLQELQSLRKQWREQRINWPDWSAHTVQLKAAHDTMRELRAA